MPSRKLILSYDKNRLDMSSNDRGCIIRFQEKVADYGKGSVVRNVYEWMCSDLDEMKKVCVGYTKYQLDELKWSDHIERIDQFLKDQWQSRINYEIYLDGDDFYVFINEERSSSFGGYHNYCLMQLPMTLVKSDVVADSTGQFLDNLDANATFGGPIIETKNNSCFEYELNGTVTLTIKTDMLIVSYKDTDNRTYSGMFNKSELMDSFVSKSYKIFEQCVDRLKYVLGGGSIDQAFYNSSSINVNGDTVTLVGSMHYRYDYSGEGTIFMLKLKLVNEQLYAV
jgi:hypothetical protein